MLLILNSMLDFPANEGDSRKLENIFKHFSEQCRDHLPKRNVNINHNLINYEKKKGPRKTVVRRNLKQYLAANILCSQ